MKTGAIYHMENVGIIKIIGEVPKMILNKEGVNERGRLGVVRVKCEIIESENNNYRVGSKHMLPVKYFNELT